MFSRATARLGAYFGIPARHVPAAAAVVAAFFVAFLVSGSPLVTLAAATGVLVVTRVIRWQARQREN